MVTMSVMVAGVMGARAREGLVAAMIFDRAPEPGDKTITMTIQ